MNFFKNEYQSFNDTFVMNYCKIPLDGTFYVPQGVCFINNYAIISCYDYKKLNNSVLFVCTKDSHKTVYLDGKMHCGGIAYHEKSDSLFVTGVGIDNKSFINRYCGKKVIDAKDLSTVTVEEIICVDTDNSLYSTAAKHSSPSYLSIYKDNLYVGNYIDYSLSKKHKGIIKKYKILSDCSLSKSYDTFLNPYSNTQGICIYEYYGNLYYIFSRSFGRKNNSLLNICTLEEGEFKTKNTIVLPSMLEQVNIHNNNLAVIFESCARCYSKTCISNNSYVYLLNLKKLLKINDTKECFYKGSNILFRARNVEITGKLDI